MKKFLVIGNPIDHSLSPKLHNFWIKKYNLDAIYGKLETHKSDLGELCENLKQGQLNGINVTVPFKKEIIPNINVLSGHALRTKSVNTISVEDGNLIGHNTDIDGFELSIKKLNYDVTNKTIIILGAGGVVPSIIYALKRMNASKIIVTNRTKGKADELKDLFNDLILLDWGDLVDFDMIINATSIGLKKENDFDHDFSQFGKNKFFYDVIYDPYETKFFNIGNQKGNNFENGLNMFLFQAQKAFNIWHNIEPDIDEETINLLKNWIMRLKNKVAIITGSASGFGKGIAKKFSEEGAKLILVDINSSLLKKVSKLLSQEYFVADVSKDSNFKSLLKYTYNKYKTVDIIVNNAGITHKPKNMEAVKENEFDKVFNVNAKSVYLCAKYFVPRMKKLKRGVILNVASTAGLSPRPKLNWYNASKGWMITATKAMAIELAPFNVRVNAIAPVAGVTPLLKSFMGGNSPKKKQAFLSTIPIGRFSTPQDMGNAACFLCSDEASMITGAILEVDGGRCI